MTPIRFLRLAAGVLLVLWTLGALALGALFTWGGDLLAAGITAFAGEGAATAWSSDAVQGLAGFATVALAVLWALGAGVLALVAVLAPRLASALGSKLDGLMNRYNTKVYS